MACHGSNSSKFRFFSQNVGLKVDVPDGVDPIVFMKLLLTDDIVAEIKDNSNHYAERVIESSRPLRRRSVLNKWTPITDDEMRKFIGFVLRMGLVGMPSYKHYWRKDTFFRNTFFSSIMSRDRFQLVMRFFHFGDKPNFAGDRLAKIRLLANHLNQIMKELYVPEKNLSLDESMML